MTQDKSLSGLISDWGGFEKLIETLHDTGNVTVERNVILKGRSGAPRQIDVLVRQKQDLYEHLIVIECKYWKKSVKREQVDALATTVKEVGASRGVIFSTVGFQSGAITEAPNHAIDLFTIRQPSDIEWGAPGRHVDMWIHLLSYAIGNLQCIGSYRHSLVNERHVAIELSFESNDSHKTRIEAPNRANRTLESLLMDLSSDSIKQVYRAAPIVFDSGLDSGILRQTITVNYDPPTPLLLFQGGGLTFIPKLTYTLGIEVSQSRFTMDRGEPFLFALAVEDCVNNRVATAARRRDGNRTLVSPFGAPAQEPHPGAFQNGSVLSVMVKGVMSFAPFASLGLGKAVQLPPAETTDEQP